MKGREEEDKPAKRQREGGRKGLRARQARELL
jgi:hypothetical protein